MKSRLISAILFVAVFACASMCFAQQQSDEHSNPPPPQYPKSSATANGNAGVWVGRDHGNDSVGGSAVGKSDADGSAKDPHSASVKAKADGEASGSDTMDANHAKSMSASKVDSSANAKGREADVKVSGSAAQDNWAVIGVDGNFAGGFNETDGMYSSDTDGRNRNAKASGSADAQGSTEATHHADADSANGSVTTKGSSSATVNADAGRDRDHDYDRGHEYGDYYGRDGDDHGHGHGNMGTASVSGNGKVAAYSSVGGNPGDTSAAMAGIQGDAAYNAAGGPTASGSLNISGTTSATKTPDSVKASSSVTSSSQASAGSGKDGHH